MFSYLTQGLPPHHMQLITCSGVQGPQDPSTKQLATKAQTHTNLTKLNWTHTNTNTDAHTQGHTSVAVPLAFPGASKGRRRFHALVYPNCPQNNLSKYEYGHVIYWWKRIVNLNTDLSHVDAV